MVKMNNQEITKHLKLPFQFDSKKLLQDLSLVIENRWIPHFNKDCYEGDWKVIPLYSIDGDETNIFAFNAGNSEAIETKIMKDCHYFKELIGHFKLPILSARILKLGVGAEIKPHRDHNLGYEDNNFRLHIPITTNDKVVFILDGIRIKMSPGECWYTNVNYIHSVSNKGKTDRVHLVIDGVRNAWSDALFFSLAPKNSFFPRKESNYSKDTLKMMIEELRRHKTSASEKLIKDLQQKLESHK